MLSPFFRSRSVLVGILLLGFSIFLAQPVQAGSCNYVCYGSDGADTLRLAALGPSCTADNDCQFTSGTGSCEAACSRFFTPAGPGVVTHYCATTEQITRICGADGHAPSARTHGDHTFEVCGSERRTSNQTCTLSAEERRLAATATTTPPPPPLPTSSTGFRCQFRCRGIETIHNGVQCADTTDQGTCLRDCNTVCRASGTICDDTGLTGSAAGVTFAPQCSGVRTDAPSAATSTAAAPSAARAPTIIHEPAPESLNDPFRSQPLPVFIGSLIRVLLGIIGALFFALLIYSGFEWMTAMGNPTQITSAQTTLKNAVIGLAVIIFCYTAVSALLTIAGQFVTGS